MRNRYSPSVDLIGQLESFVSVAETGSFTRGAELRSIPQPVVSRRVAALEKRLGGRLLTRTSRSVELTPFGRSLLPHATDLVAKAHHFVERARAHTVEFVIGMPPEADARALVAARHAAEDAGLALGFVECAPTERAASLGAGSASAALVPCPPDEADMSAVLGAGTAGNALRGRRIHVDQLRRHDRHERPGVVHIDAEDDVPWVRDVVRRAARSAGLRPDQVDVGSARTAALTAAYEYADVIVCTQVWAARNDLRWRQLAGVDVRRSYTIALPSGATPPEGFESAIPALARAVGLEPTREIA